MKKALATAVAGILFGLCAQANIVVNPDLSSGLAGTWSGNGNFGGVFASGGTGIASPGNHIYDGGWISWLNGTAHWEVTGGQLSRTATGQYNYGGIGQMISNPGNGTFDNGDTVTFGFDYMYNGTTGGGLAGSVYGITAPNGTNATWNLSAGEAISNLGQTASPTITADYTTGTDYQFYLLDTFSDTSASATRASYASANITLTRQYDLFVVVFQAKPNGAGAGTVTVDNVNFSSIPEPATIGMLGLGTLVALMLRRTR